MTDIFQMMKEKLNEIQANPGALFGLLYPYLLVIIVAVGLYYTGNLDFIARQKVPAFIMDSTVVADLSIQPAKTVPPTNIFDFAEPSADLLAEGEKLFKANCSSCHGENGTGGGPAAMGLNPAPKNFTDNQNWKNGNTLSGIYTTLQEGITGGAMVAYDYLLPTEKLSLAHYIRETFVTDAPKDSKSELEALDLTYNLSAGQQLPAQIPVAAAKQILISQIEDKMSNVQTSLLIIENDRSKGADLFRSVSIDSDKAVSFLIQNSGWKQNEQSFINYVLDNVNQNGFSVKVINLKSDEWSALFSYLNAAIKS